MRFRFFAIPVFDPGPAEAELNAFLGQHVVCSVERQLVQAPHAAAWAVCVGYQAAAEAGRELPSPKKGRLDYREVLSESDFRLYARLRDLRKTLAEAQGVPAYTLFTNEQLPAMVTHRVTTKDALAKLDGIGEARVTKYADAFLDALRSGRAGESDA